MALSTGSDLVTLRRVTKGRLAAIKGTSTFDDAIRVLLDATPASEARARLDLVRIEAANVAAALARPGGTPRTASKQRLLAAVARERRLQWLDQGRLVPMGPRRTRYVAPERPGTETTKVVRRGR